MLGSLDKITDLFCGHLLIPAVTDDNICTLPAKSGGYSFKATLLTCRILINRIRIPAIREFILIYMACHLFTAQPTSFRLFQLTSEHLKSTIRDIPQVPVQFNKEREYTSC